VKRIIFQERNSLSIDRFEVRRTSLKLSLSNGIFSKYPLDENIAAVRRHGFENLEFNMKCVEEEDEESVYTAKKLIDAHGLNCLTLHSATLPVKDENEIAKAVYYGKVSADFAHKLSAPVLVVHSNVSRRLPENLRKRFMTKIFRELNPYAKSLSLKLALENLSYASTGFGKNVTEIEEILSIVDDDAMGVTLDFCHAEATGQTLSLLEKYKNRLLNVHISNRAHRAFDAETPNLNAFLTKLQEYGYTGPLTMELNRKCTTEEILKTKTIIEKILSKNVARGVGFEPTRPKGPQT
jgi:sugar phosphate isomerase/epimerase